MAGAQEIAGGAARGIPPRVARAQTINDLLARHQLLRRQRRRRPWTHPGSAPLTTTRPNQVWPADFKGEFKTGDGRYCYPLTVTDHYSRVLLVCQALPSIRGAGVQPVFRTLFRTVGLPDAIRTDNGLPQKSRRQSFSDLTNMSASTHDANRQAVPPTRNHTLTIVTQGLAHGRPALTRLNRASYSRWKVRALSTRSHAPRRLLAKGSSRLVSSLPGSGDSRCRS